MKIIQPRGVDKSYVDTQIATVNASPKGVYTTVPALQTAFPTGNNNIYLVTGNVNEVDSLAVTATPTASGNVTVTLNGVATPVAVTIATAEVASLTVTAPSTVASNVTVTLDGVPTTVAVLATDTAIQVADKIRAATFTGWTTGGTVGTTTVTFTATTTGNKVDATYSAGTTGATGTMSTTTQGAAADTATDVATKIRATAFTGWTTSGSGTTVTFTATVGGSKTAPSYSAGTTGATGTMTVTTTGYNPDGKWYYWNSSAWTAGGTYQSTGLGVGTVTPNKASFISLSDDPNYVPANTLSGVVWSDLGFVRNATGATNAFTNWKCTTLIPVLPNTTYNLNGRYGSWNYILYDINGVNGVQTSLGLVSNGSTITINVPSDKYFIAFNANQTASENFNLPLELYRMTQVDTEKLITIPKFNVNTVITDKSITEIKLSDALANKLNSHLLTNKKIVMFGDSNIGNFTTDGIPSLLQTELGITAYNVGFGATRMSTHPSPEYDAFCMHSLADSVSSGNWAVQDNAISGYSLPSQFPGALATLKSIDWSTIDYVSVCHGSNDWTNYMTKPDNLSDPMDWNSFKGGFRYFYEKLITKNPKIKFLLMTSPFRGIVSGQTETSDTLLMDHGATDYYLYQFIDATIELAKEYKIPCLDLYYEGGINSKNWAQYLSDGAHYTLESRQIVARRVAQEIRRYL